MNKQQTYIWCVEFEEHNRDKVFTEYAAADDIDEALKAVTCTGEGYSMKRVTITQLCSLNSVLRANGTDGLQLKPDRSDDDSDSV